MSAPSPDLNHNGRLTRRVFIGVAASVLYAPAIVRATSLMPVRSIIMPAERPYAGFVDRLLYDGCDKARLDAPKVRFLSMTASFRRPKCVGLLRMLEATAF
jgi:hypothetical protein